MKYAPSIKSTRKHKKFLGVSFITCQTYGRLYENDSGDAYVGMCPRCGKRYNVLIGKHGTSVRMFRANCQQ